MKFISLNVDPTKDMVMSLVGNNSVVAARASVSGLGAEDPSTVTFTIDEDFPTSFEEWTDADNNVFVKIPTMYRTIDNVTDGQITAFTISTAPLNSNSQPYSVFVKPNGDIMPYVCIGKYASTNNAQLDSKSGTPVATKAADARTAARANGLGYQLYDWQFEKLFVDLSLVIGQKGDFQDGTAAITEYLGIANLAETTGIWVDGVMATLDNKWAYCTDPTKYANYTDGLPEGYSAASYVIDHVATSGLVVKLGYDASVPFLNYPSYIGNSQVGYHVFYCDSVNIQSKNSAVRVINGRALASAGLWCVSGSASTTSSRARLCYRPLSLTI